MIGERLRALPKPPMPDRWLGGLTLALLLLGLIMVASSSVAVAEQGSGGALALFWRQAIYALLGAFVVITLTQIPLAAFEQNSMLLLGGAILLLLLVLVPGIGVEVNNARRWIDLGIIRLQASEPARLMVVLYVAGFIVRRQVEVQYQLRGLAKPLLVIALACLLLLLQPDFGAAVILAAICFLMLFLGGVRLRYLFVPVLATVGAFAMLAVAQPYRVRRLLGFSDPWAHVETAGWQLSQSLIAIGRGGWFGEGLGNSLQKMLYLPEQHTDFIFAIFAEEFGLFGVLVLLALYMGLCWRGLQISAVAEARGARFAGYLGYALSYWLAFQVLVNLAVNMGLLPTKGLTLPLMSYGGSSLLTVCAMVGLLLRIDVENRAASPGHDARSKRSRVGAREVAA